MSHTVALISCSLASACCGWLCEYLVARLRARRSRRPKISTSEPNVFGDGFVLPIIEDPRWKRYLTEEGPCYRLGLLSVERRYLDLENRVLPDKFGACKMAWAVILDKSSLPLRLPEIEAYARALSRRFDDEAKKRLQDKLQAEITGNN